MPCLFACTPTTDTAARAALAIDDAATVPAEFYGVATWSMLNTLDGSIDGEAVEWQSATPDLP